MKSIEGLFTKIKHYPLSYRLVGYVVLVSSLFALMATATQLYLDYRRDISTLYDSINFIQKSYLPTIAASTFKIDTEHVNLELEGALKLPDIVYLEVQELRGSQVTTYSKGNPEATQVIRREFPLEYVSPVGEKRAMRSLIVNASLTGVYQRLWSRVLTILATNLVKTFLVSVCILSILYLLVTRHLTQIVNYTQEMVPGENNHPLTLSRQSRQTDKPDELENVVIAINRLQDRVALSMTKLKEAELNYRTVADFTYDWEYWVNLDGKLNYVSPSCERISGYTMQEFKENPLLIHEIIVPEDKGIWDQHYHNSLKEFRKRELQFRIRRRDSKVCWIEHACRPVHDSQGKPIGVRVSNRDITRRKTAEIDMHKAFVEIEQLKNRLEAETAYLQEEIKLEHDYEGIVGKSAAIQYVFYKINQVAATDTGVLVLGETGTGKELVCRALHSSSLRKDRPLMKVNCAALPANLIESELFGHERGAFTGAQNRRHGRFEVADGATIFLDEIAELPLELQGRLLRVLQDGEFERLGSSMTVKVDVRVIAATNRDLEKLIQKGRFREDLYYRLSVFPITIPPLRERREDIILLARFFVDKIAKRMGKSITLIPERVMTQLVEYPWPGNVRELQNVIERSVINSAADKLHLVDDLRREDATKDDEPLQSLRELERVHIMRVLVKTGWRIAGPKGAAKILEINPNTLRSRMRKLGIKSHNDPSAAAFHRSQAEETVWIDPPNQNKPQKITPSGSIEIPNPYLFPFQLLRF